MLTIEVKVNGKLVAEATLRNLSGLAEESDYDLHWLEQGGAALGIMPDAGDLLIGGHRRRQTVWALVAKAAAAILGQKIDAMEGKG